MNLNHEKKPELKKATAPSELRVHPRRLARSIAKKQVGRNGIAAYDWRRIAVDASRPRKKKGAKK